MASPAARSRAPVRISLPTSKAYTAHAQGPLLIVARPPPCTRLQSVCPAGTYSLAGSSSCTTCPSGSTSSAGASSCTCTPGFAVSGSGASLSCTGTASSHARRALACAFPPARSRLTRLARCCTRTACLAGTYSPTGTPCARTCSGPRPPAVRAAPTLASTSCADRLATRPPLSYTWLACSPGTYSAANASICQTCPSSSTSSGGSATCACNAGFSTSGFGTSLVCTGTRSMRRSPLPPRRERPRSERAPCPPPRVAPFPTPRHTRAVPPPRAPSSTRVPSARRVPRPASRRTPPRAPSPTPRAAPHSARRPAPRPPPCVELTPSLSGALFATLACASGSYGVDGLTCQTCPPGSTTSGTGATSCACLGGYASSGSGTSLVCTGTSSCGAGTSGATAERADVGRLDEAPSLVDRLHCGLVRQRWSTVLLWSVLARLRPRVARPPSESSYNMATPWHHAFPITACFPNTYSAPLAAACTACPTGSTSAESSSTCVCNAGYASSGVGSTLLCGRKDRTERPATVYVI